MTMMILAATALAGLGVFWKLPARDACWSVFLVGWWTLPAAVYPRLPRGSEFAYWITGFGLPSDIAINKAWALPLFVLLGSLAKDWRQWKHFRFVPFDAMVVAWCLWPLLQQIFLTDADPVAWWSTPYLMLSWGGPWLLGRLYGDREGLVRLAQWCVVVAAAMTPLALLEGVLGPELYELMYGYAHPFRFDGDDRYIGSRPIIAFEHGNQYGVWVAAAAFAAIWLYRAGMPLRPGLGSDRAMIRPGLSIRHDAVDRMLGCVVIGLAVVGQSVGSLVLLFAGCVALLMIGKLRGRTIASVVIGILIMGCVFYVTALGPLSGWARGSELAKQLIGWFRSIGRASFFWRFSQDAKSIAHLRGHLLLGTGDWDWWRPLGTRPWGLFQLLLGQFGLVGLATNLAIWCFVPLVRLWNGCPSATLESHRGVDTQLVMAWGLVTIAIAFGDAFFNAFLYYPALIIVGGLASPRYARENAS